MSAIGASEAEVYNMWDRDRRVKEREKKRESEWKDECEERKAGRKRFHQECAPLARV